MALTDVRSKAVALLFTFSLFIVAPIVRGDSVLVLFWYVVLSVVSSIAIILMGKKELFALL